jgi:hypothetical protein
VPSQPIFFKQLTSPAPHIVRSRFVIKTTAAKLRAKGCREKSIIAWKKPQRRMQTERCMYVSAGKAGREKKIYGRQKKKIYIKCVVVWYTMK